ncbi:Endonuclease MutS2 [Castellaniella defragrans]
MKASKSTLSDLRQLHAFAGEEGDATPAAKPGRSKRPARKPSGRRKAIPKDTRDAPPDTAGGARATPAPVLDAGDLALFQQAMRFVQPLAHHGGRARSPHREPEALLHMRRAHAQGADAPQERPTPRSHRRAPTAAADPEAQEFLQPGCGPDLLRGLRRGKWLPEAILDLHGSSEEQAHDRLDRFVSTCVEHGIRCVRIVHGKGIGSRHGSPILKSAVRIHLGRLLAVQAWVQCAEPDGGAGAVTALLRLPEGLQP